MKIYQTNLTLESRNPKTGPIPVSTTTASTCPTACPLQRSGCYAETGPMSYFWRKVTQRRVGTNWSKFCEQVAALPKGIIWRHNQAGDLPGDKQTIDKPALEQLVRANQGKMGFTYTHYDALKNKSNREAIKAANNQGFTVNLSGNNLNHADKLAALNIAPVVVILPPNTDPNADIFTPNGKRVVVCPATYKEQVQCMSCKLCYRQRESIVGFPAHGAAKNKAFKAANGA